MKTGMMMVGAGLLFSAVSLASANFRPMDHGGADGPAREFQAERPEQEPEWRKAARRQLKKAYPKAEAGMTRHVLYLKPMDHEADVQVELIVGKTVEVDGVNQHFFGGAIKPETVQGWGYTKYVVEKGTFDRMMGTLMAVPPDAEKVKRFVRVSTPGPYLVRYNSRLPIVVYVPEGGEVRYRLWHADGDGQAMSAG